VHACAQSIDTFNPPVGASKPDWTRLQINKWEQEKGFLKRWSSLC